ncbi:DUF397 domain-containing protein [Micromonospora narathiwatensis]|uniref:DUF397 domain-containing protein n=1 Tax=Micromonospora narathiwatensis TaxID=299146 RepID=A0A1A8Z0W4_9ACTN|nr:DUF397 domain-containing protein [Micromonospora narathiwatensis]SBT37467.1 protein of unknown function (DUF397) [Micromonospora narathiwatensis]
MNGTNSPRPPATGWRKSSHSGDEGACVEMALLPEAVAVRDSKDPSGPVLVFPPAAWAAFTGAPPRG